MDVKCCITNHERSLTNDEDDASMAFELIVFEVCVFPNPFCKQQRSKLSLLCTCSFKVIHQPYASHEAPA